MRKLKKIPIAAALLLCVITILPAQISASANSAMLGWYYGVPQFGTVNYDGCPLKVTHEDLTFNIDSFPHVYDYYYGEDESDSSKNYTARVTASYSFYNPTESDVTATLAFPFGTLSRYYSADMLGVDSDKYDITLNGEKVQKTLRATYYSGDFETAADVSRLNDDYIKDDFYSPELTVTAYTYTVSGIPKKEIKNNAPYASFRLKESDCNRVIVSSCSGGRRLDNGDVTIGKFVNNGEDITVFVIGEPLAYPIDFKIYRNGGEEKQISGNAVLSDKIYTVSFLDIALHYRKDYYEVSEIDWYNAVVEKLNDHRDHLHIYGIYDLDVIYDLMRWFVYEISVPANSTAVNSVTAPLYPDIHVGYNPPVYRYDYLLSPAATWSSFGDIDITINTPYHLNIGDFEVSDLNYTANEGGHTAHLNELPSGELSFTLCESESPEIIRHNSNFLGVYIIIIVICCTLAFAIISFIAITLLTQRKKTKPE